MHKLRKALLNFWTNLNSNYWFVPFIMSVFSILLAILAIELDHFLDASTFKKISWLYTNQVDGARALLSIVSSSMMSVAGVTFSMTLISVSHASSQIGPRILSGFMKDRGTQITLGTFVSTFLYSLVVLINVSGVEEGAKENSSVEVFIPHIAIIGAVLMGVASIVVLIYFINHVSKLINMTLAINTSGDRLLRGMQNVYPGKIGRGEFKSNINIEEEKMLLDAYKESKNIILANGKGYIRKIDSDLLLKIAKNNDLTILIVRRPGEFVCDGSLLAKTGASSKIDDELQNQIRSAFIWGAEKTMDQDVLFSVDLLIEIAARALSPGINDPFTAIECMDQIQAGMHTFDKGEIESKFRFDEENNLRVIAKSLNFQSFSDHTFDQLRHYVKADSTASLHLFKVFKNLVESLLNKSSKEQIFNHTDYLYEACKQNIDDKRDLERILEARNMVLSLR